MPRRIHIGEDRIGTLNNRRTQVHSGGYNSPFHVSEKPVRIPNLLISTARLLLGWTEQRLWRDEHRGLSACSAPSFTLAPLFQETDGWAVGRKDRFGNRNGGSGPILEDAFF
jgi:hypothetical protein